MRGATVFIISNIFGLVFQSTRPVRGATIPCAGEEFITGVSIHAPRAGRDTLIPTACIGGLSFNPRAPCGARPTVDSLLGGTSKFQSMRPVRGATRAACRRSSAPTVSIHAPRAGRDTGARGLDSPSAVSIHAPRAGRDQCRRCSDIRP